MVKNLPAMQDTWVQFLGWEDHLEKGLAAHSSILAWKIPWIEEPGGLQSIGSQRVRQTERLTLSLSRNKHQAPEKPDVFSVYTRHMFLSVSKSILSLMSLSFACADIV